MRLSLASNLAPALLALTVAACNGDVGASASDGALFRLDDLALPEDGGTLTYNDPPDLIDDKSGPPYPFVLVHGMAGFRNIGPIDYFYDIPDALTKDGHDVWVSRQDPINSSEVRGAEVLAYVQTVLMATGKAKVNLVAHSQGGYDARYVASLLGDHVATLVTIATPNEGDPIADAALADTGPAAQQVLTALLNIYGALNGFDSDARAQITELTTTGAAAFFAKYPDDPHVAYFSIAGRSEMSLGGSICDSAAKPPFVSRWDNYQDPMDPLFTIFANVLDAEEPAPVHDGLVPVSSAKHGLFLGCIPADHMDEVNQLLGDSPGAGNPFDAVQFYRDLLDWVAAKGF